MESYTEDNYRSIHEGSRRSAREIAPLVLELVRPNSVIDLGCGLGTWLSVFKDFGVEDVFGVDCEWVDKSLLEIPQECFLTFDLKDPLHLDRQFDLVLSLEVAQHPPPEC